MYPTRGISSLSFWETLSYPLTCIVDGVSPTPLNTSVCMTDWLRSDFTHSNTATLWRKVGMTSWITFRRGL